MIVIAGPNGSGKTSVTKKFLHHEWAEGTVYINPDEVAKEVETIASVVDRLYVYDNSVDYQDARLQFRLTNGSVAKTYVADIPQWARNIFPAFDAI